MIDWRHDLFPETGNFCLFRSPLLTPLSTQRFHLIIITRPYFTAQLRRWPRAKLRRIRHQPRGAVPPLWRFRYHRRHIGSCTRMGTIGLPCRSSVIRTPRQNGRDCLFSDCDAVRFIRSLGNCGQSSLIGMIDDCLLRWNQLRQHGMIRRCDRCLH